MEQPSKQSPHSSFECSEERALLNEVRSLQSRLERLCDTSIDVLSIQHDVNSAEAERRARDILRVRRRREALFGSGLFGEPAWDMLLELYATELGGRCARASDLCRVSGVPSSTALRWIKMLEDHGWITRLPDQRDARRSFLSLTDKSKIAMERFFAQPELANPPMSADIAS